MPRVKIATEGMFEKERHGAGSVVEVSDETLALNTSWMTPTDEPLNKVPPAADKVAKGDSKKSEQENK
jgi:hypothetical protein